MRRAAIVALGLALTSCGGGGGGDDGGGGAGTPQSGVTFNVSTTALTFSADSPVAAIPATQNIVGSITGNLNSLSGTLYILIGVAGPAVTDVPVSIDTVNARGTGTVTVADPKVLGSGSFQSTLTVRACMNDATCATGQLNGSPRTINVAYTVGSSLQRDGVYPPVVAAGVPGSVIIRRAAIGATVTSVTFGGVAATSFTQVSSSEVQASYPALSAGAKTIAFNGNATPLSLNSVDVPSFPATTLTHATARRLVGSLVYDAERQQLLATLIEGDDPTVTNHHLVAYRFDAGLWQAPTTLTIERLRAVALDSPSSTLLVARQYVLEERSATDLSLLRSTPAPADISQMEFQNDVLLANDGNVLVVADYHGTGPTQPRLYSTTTRNMVALTTRFGLEGTISAGAAGASGDGSRIVIAPASYDTHVREYRASTGRLSSLPLIFDTSYSRVMPALDRTGTRIVLSSTTQTNVYDSNYALLGTLPASTHAVAVNSAGTRAYTYDADGTIRTFDISATANGGSFNELGTALPVGNITQVGWWVRMILTPDDKTAIVAGSNAIAIQPVAP